MLRTYILHMTILCSLVCPSIHAHNNPIAFSLGTFVAYMLDNEIITKAHRNTKFTNDTAILRWCASFIITTAVKNCLDIDAHNCRPNDCRCVHHTNPLDFTGGMIYYACNECLKQATHSYLQ